MTQPSPARSCPTGGPADRRGWEAYDRPRVPDTVLVNPHQMFNDSCADREAAKPPAGQPTISATTRLEAPQAMQPWVFPTCIC
ncbi:hypothetical protein E2C01_009888 [Portunus trituberculatus]|uniref:Uncharacterized protein n=1 Tax=Portunus trituberculatus TaxID=210409 RepID=A0A5B7D770_PORTR|nr:hypothetical protein [Portunus trituberculatus]